MANPLSIVQAIIDLALKIKNVVETFRYNREDCRKIGELVATVRDVAEGLRKTTEKDDGGALVGGALKALKQALERAWDLVVACQRKNAVLRALDADAIAMKLRRVYLDVSLNLSAVVLANGAYNTSKLADINGIVADLRADVAYNTSKLAEIYGIVAALRADVACNTWMLAKILGIVAALPDALHLQQEVPRLVQSFSDSTNDDASYYQNENTRVTKKTVDVARYSTYSSSYTYPVARLVSFSDSTDDDASDYQTENSTSETKKTDDVARYSTYSSSHAYPSYNNCKTQAYDGCQGAQRQYTVPCDQQRYCAAGSLGPSSIINSYYYYWEQQWLWRSGSRWQKTNDGKRYPEVNIVIFTKASFKYALGHETFLAEPPPDSSPDRDRVVVIKDMKQWESHWDRAVPYNKLLVYGFYPLNVWNSSLLAADMLFGKLAKQYKGKADFCKFDVINLLFLAALCGVEGASPTFVLFKNCKQVGKVVSLKEDQLERSIQRALNILV